ncbi:hypothetical protein [Mesorhizobium sp. LNJC405B00]|uniref:hypothetical protein n=1 Tax=unclassified Mesorhizobium TaxID=325217 RepID=UPI0004010A13|nr:hypothetical protein [Mesorhizobium sp. LNJC405B00]
MPHATVSTKRARGAVNQITNMVTLRHVPDSAAASNSELKSSMDERQPLGSSICGAS